MKHTLPKLIVAAVGALAATSALAQTPQSSTPAGQELLVQAAQQVYRQPALSAKIRERVRMFGEELAGSGAYLQLGDAPEKMLRLDLKLQLAGHVSTLQQVSNGGELWTCRQVLDKSTVTFVDLQRVRHDLAAAHPERPLDYAADWMVLGGLPALLKGLHDNFQFGSAQGGEFKQRRVWVLEGKWKPAELAKLLPDQREAILAGRSADLAALPPEAPTQVQVVLGADDLFPCQIEFRRERPAGGAGEGTAWEAMLTMEFFDVQFAAQLDPLQFQYKAAAQQEVADHTELYLRKLGVSGLKTAAGAGEGKR